MAHGTVCWGCVGPDHKPYPHTYCVPTDTPHGLVVRHMAHIPPIGVTLSVSTTHWGAPGPMGVAPLPTPYPQFKGLE